MWTDIVTAGVSFLEKLGHRARAARYRDGPARWEIELGDDRLAFC